MDLTIPSEYGYVLFVALASTFVNQWHGIKVGSARRAAKVPYPNAYAPHAEAPTGSEKYVFNCAQRAHANFIEHLPQFYVSLFVSGLGFPKLAAGLGSLYLFGRVLYAIGYANPQKQNGTGRFLGAPFFYPGLLGLWGSAGYVCYKMITGA
ncbi:hypothetical protein Dda_4132 [Drechslerella dactyloides]|uniref:Microsomal glutathione S-transferase 3 n=1 Tax=Drechslerella dactyloides TaxID=74499 RepID=A0AAD6J3M5_DREDA|nr:hypothetical protein Dda_4132 [Drechslerella dactyloides]